MLTPVRLVASPFALLTLSTPFLSWSRCLHALDDLFSKLVEAVSEVGKREEECRVVEKETDRLLRWQGGTTRLEVRWMIVGVGYEREGYCCFR